MFCSNCGKEFEGNFCPFCGAPAPKELRETKCPDCGHLRGEGELFCSMCGRKFDSATYNYNRMGSADRNRFASANRGTTHFYGNDPTNANNRNGNNAYNANNVRNANNANDFGNPDSGNNANRGNNNDNGGDNAYARADANAGNVQGENVYVGNAHTGNAHTGNIHNGNADAGNIRSGNVYAGAGVSRGAYVKKSVIENVYSALYYLPAIIFALFSALLFAFFSASVAGTPAFELFGEKVPAESAGNVYTMISDCPDVKNLMIALIAIAAATFIAAIAFLFVALSGRAKSKFIRSGEKIIPKVYVVYVIEAILAAAFIVIGIILINKAPNIKLTADEEFPMDDIIVLEAGACPKLIIAFAITTFVAIIGCIAARSVILARRPEFAAADWKNAEPPKGAENVGLPVSMDEFYFYSSSLFALKNVVAFIIIGIVPFAVRYRGLIDCFAAGVFNLRSFAFLLIGNLAPFFFVCAISCFWFAKVKEMKKNIKFVVILLVVGAAILVLGALSDKLDFKIPENVAKIIVAAAVIAAAVLIMIGIMNFVTICKLSGYRKTTRKVFKEAKSLPQRKGLLGETKSKLKKYAVDGDYENFNAILEEIHNEYKEIKEKQIADFLAKKEEILAKFG